MSLESALALRERGLALLPLQPRGKDPHHAVLDRVYGSPAWSPLRERRASGPEIRAWHEADPACNVGVICGQASGGLAVLDVDDPSSARALRHPPTPTVATSRGHHLYLRADGDAPNRDWPWGELRGEGRYTVAPDSTHESGHAYEWRLGLDHPLAALSEIIGVEVPRQRDPSALTTSACVPGLDSPGDLARSDQAVRAIAALWGMPAEPGRATSCVLPGHGPDRHPSASLTRSRRSGVWRYRDWHAARHGTPPWLSLAEVHASRCAGRVVELRPPAQVRWWARLAHDAGLRPVEPPAMRLPAEALDDTARRVAEGFALLLALRREPGPAPYTRAFAAAWCGVGERQAGEAIAGLRRIGVLRVAGQHGRLALYLPGGTS